MSSSLRQITSAWPKQNGPNIIILTKFSREPQKGEKEDHKNV